MPGAEVIEIPTALVVAFCSLGALLITVGGLVVRQAVTTSQNQASAKAARAIADEAKADAKSAFGRVERVEKELSDFREHVARQYVSREAMAEVERRVVAAIESVGSRVDHFAGLVIKRDS